MDHRWTMTTNVVRSPGNQTASNCLTDRALLQNQYDSSKSHTAFTRQRPVEAAQSTIFVRDQAIACTGGWTDR